MNIAKIMIPKALTVVLSSSSTVRKGLEIMRDHGYTAIPVLNEEGLYIGCATEGDFLRHILKTGTTDVREHEKYKIESIVRKEFCPALPITASDQQVIDSILQQNFVPIVDDRGCLCGILTRRAVIATLAEKLAEKDQPQAPAAAGTGTLSEFSYSESLRHF